MIKKIIVVLITFLVITGCNDKNLSELDIDKAVDKVETTLNNMQDILPETLEDVYGMDLTKMEEYVIKQNGDGDFYAIIKTTDKSYVKEIMDSYFEKVKEYDEAYAPDRLDLLDNKVDKEVGNYLIYVVSSDANSIYNDIIDTMN